MLALLALLFVGSSFASQEAGCGSSNLDLMILVDESGSVVSRFQSHQSLLLDILHLLRIGPEHSRVSLIRYSDEPRVVLGFDELQSRGNIVTQIVDLQPDGGPTSTASAIALAVSEFRRAGRSTAIPVLILLTDGHTQDKWSNVLAAAESVSGATVFVLTLTEDVYLPELELYSPDRDNIFLPDRVSAFIPRFKDFLSAVPCASPRKKRGADSCALDLLVILDTSGSTAQSFEQDRDLALRVIEPLTIGAYSTRVSLVSFSASSRLELDFYAGTNKDSVREALKSVEWTGGNTQLADAVRLGISQLEQYKRPDAESAVLMLTDGNSGDMWDEVLRTAEQLKQTGAQVFAATRNPVPQVEELDIYADETFLGYNADNVIYQVQSLTSGRCQQAPVPAPAPPPPVLFSQDSCFFDVVLLLDTSGSVQQDFEQEKRIAEALVESLPLESGNTRVAVLRFSSSADVRLDLNAYQGRAEVMAAVRGIEFTGKDTDLVQAVNLVVSQLNSARSDAQKFAFLITDGNSKNAWYDVLDTAKRLEYTGASVYSITSSSVYSEIELREYADPDSQVFIGWHQALAAIAEIEGITKRGDCQPTYVAPAPAPPPVQAPPAVGCGVDLVVVFDSSGSIAEEFEKQQRELLQLVSSLPIGPSATRVGLVRFHDETFLEMDLWRGQDRQEVLNTVRNIPFTGGNTYIARAVEMGLGELRRARPDARQVLLLVSDGNSGDEWAEIERVAADVKRSGVDVYALTYSPDYSIDELSAYTGNQARVFADRNARGIEQELSFITNAATCQAPTAPPPPKWTPPPPVQFQKDCQDVVEIVVVLDRSGSVEEVYQRQKDLGIQLLRDHIPNANEVSVSVVSFSHSPQLEVSMTRDRAAAISAIQNVEFTGGDTAIASAMDVAVGELRRSGSNVAKIILLISDGNSRDPWDELLRAAQNVQDVADRVYAVSYSRSLNYVELEKYTGDRERVYSEGDVQRFLRDVQDDIRKSACSLSEAIQTRPPYRPDPTTPVPRRKPVQQGCSDYDVAIVIDRSGSRAEEFVNQVDTALSLVQIVPTASAVSIVSFADDTNLELSLGSGRSTEELTDVVSRIEHSGGNTNLAQAVLLSLSDYNARKRSSAKSVLVLITDGQSQDRWEEVLDTANRVKDTFDEIFAVGLGQISPIELQQYTGRNERVYRGKQKFLADARRLLSTQCSFRVDVEPTVTRPAPQPVYTPAPAPKCYPYLDLVLVFDASGSVEEVFENQKSIAIDLLGSLPFPPESYDLRMGLVTYSQGSQTLIRLSDTQDRSSILRKITDIRYEGGSTATAGAVRDAIGLLAEARPGAKKVVLLMTDGHSQDDWSTVQQTAQDLRNAATTVYSLGMSPDLYLNELEEYAGSSDNVYDKDRVSEFSRRLTEEVRQTQAC